MSVLNRASILAAQDTPTIDVKIPEWKGSVRVRTLTAQARDFLELGIDAERKEMGGAMANIRARYAIACTVGEDGEPLFTLDDLEALGQKSGNALDKIYQAAEKLNKLSPGDVETAAKN